MQPFTCSRLSLLAILTLLAYNFIIISATSRFWFEFKPESDTNANYTEFIKTSCETTTRYPDLCFKKLSPYANTIKTSAVELANVALTVSLESAKSASKAVMELAKGEDLSSREGEAVADCLDSMSDSVDELQKSMVAMKDIDGPDFKEKMGDVMTWVSAAMTDDDTCMDGFDGNGNGGGKHGRKIKETIRGYILNVAELTSIALAFINNLSST